MTPPQILVFGASSAVGAYLLPLLAEGGWPVIAQTRMGVLPADSNSVRWITASLPQAPMPAVPVTHVLSLGPCDLFTDWLRRQQPSANWRQVIAFGSTSANTKIDSGAASERALAQRLRAAEATLAEEAARLRLQWTLLRPTMIYGGSNDLIARIARHAARWHVYPRLLGRVAKARRQPVHAADLALATLAAIDCPAATNQSFDLPGGESLPLAQLVRRAALAGTRWCMPLPLPLAVALKLAWRLGLLPTAAALGPDSLQRLAQDQLFDGSAARSALGYSPRPFEPRADGRDGPNKR